MVSTLRDVRPWRAVPGSGTVELMESTTERLLPFWAGTARETFLTSWGLVPLVAILNQLDLIDSRSGFWLLVSIVLAAVWTISGLTWAAGEYRRRRGTSPSPGDRDVPR
jgi:hypothetical protein